MKVLIADDEPLSKRILENYLIKWGYEPVIANNGREALDMILSDSDIKMAILDWMMPEMDGLQVCEAIRKADTGGYKFLILLTAKNKKEDLVSGMDAGADDYIIKPFDKNELRVRLRAGRRIIEFEEALVKAKEELRIQAMYDSLTGLLNHGAIVNILLKEISRAKREGTPLGLIMGDIDHFKKINDEFGHLAGDDVLKVVAEKIKACLRSYNYVGRYGGEEFLIILSNCNADCVKIIGERIRHTIENTVVETSVGKIVSSISLGGMSTVLREDIDPASLIKIADDALYQAKNSGRNKFIFIVNP